MTDSQIHSQSEQLLSSQKRIIPSPHQGQRNASANFDGSLQEIGIAAALVSIPLAVLSVALLAVVSGFQIDTSHFTGLGPGQEQITGAYVVELSATTIALIASYSSTVAPIAVGFAMTLLSYSASHDIKKYSERDQSDKLPTPYQLGLLINMKSGSVGSLWPWFKYRFQVGRVKHKTTSVVKAFGIGLATALFISYIPCACSLMFQFVDYACRHMAPSRHKVGRVPPNPTKYSYQICFW